VTIRITVSARAQWIASPHFWCFSSSSWNFWRKRQGNRLGILDLSENPGAGKRPVVSPSIQGEIPALKGQESRGKSRHVPLGKKTEIQPSDDHMRLALGVDTLVTAGAAPSNHFRQTAAAATKAGLKREFEFEWQEGIGLMRSNRVRARTIPKGLRPPAQGCEERATLGKRRSKMTTATRLRPCLAGHVQSQTYFSSHSISCLRKSRRNSS